MPTDPQRRPQGFMGILREASPCSLVNVGRTGGLVHVWVQVPAVDLSSSCVPGTA